jgi:hypothetical protein
MDRYSLPHGAKGIEADGFAVNFAGDKLVFIPKSEGAGKHYTLHAGPKSGVIDLHETEPAADGGEQHRTLFAVRHDDLPALLGEATPMLREFLDLVRPLRLGWLKRKNIGIARGIDPASDADIAAVTRKHTRRLTLEAGLYRQNVFVPEYLEDVYDFPDGNFSLFHRGRNIGIGFKTTDADGSVRLFWIKRRDLMHFGSAWQAKVMDALRRIAIPPERYPDYPFLSS